MFVAVGRHRSTLAGSAAAAVARRRPSGAGPSRKRSWTDAGPGRRRSRTDAAGEQKGRRSHGTGGVTDAGLQVDNITVRPLIPVNDNDNEREFIQRVVINKSRTR